MRASTDGSAVAESGFAQLKRTRAPSSLAVAPVVEIMRHSSDSSSASGRRRAASHLEMTGSRECLIAPRTIDSPVNPQAP